MRLVFILPGGGGTGGAHSVVQEAIGLVRLGAEVSLALSQESAEGFRWHYPELEGSGVGLRDFKTIPQLAALVGGFDLAIATSAPSAHMLAEALDLGGAGAVRPAYYVQDYEPLLFMPGARKCEDARASYGLFRDALLFAKTGWLRRIVYDNHGRAPAKVEASIDHEVYRPRERSGGDLVISAMVRPKTPRRGPRRTVRILNGLAAQVRAGVSLVVFGCGEEELNEPGLRLSPQVARLGVLRREQVAEVLAGSDLFLDLSDYQAFGRTGLEAMACGCVPVLPVFGGADEFARHGRNGFLVDTRSDEAILAVADSFIAADPAARQALRACAISTASQYTVEKAARSEYQVFSAHLSLTPNPQIANP
jgi:glycosyltransferase involved in cell wall biosynthesis